MGEVTDVLVLDILACIDLENSFYKFCDGVRFLEERKRGRVCNMLMRCSRSFSGYGSHLNGDILIGKCRSNFFLEAGMNDPQSLKNSFGNLGRVLPVFNEKKIQEHIRGHVVSECKENEYEGIGITIFGFM